MISYHVEDDYFDYVKVHPDYKVVIYGAGSEAKKRYKFFERIDFFCDQNAQSIESIENIPCILPNKLAEIHEKMIVLICVKQKAIIEEIRLGLEGLQIDAEVFFLNENPAFSYASQYSCFLPLLPVIKSKMIEKQYLKIVDIGGRRGENFLRLSGLSDGGCIEWHVVEQEKRCRQEQRRQLPDNVHFHMNKEEGWECFDKEIREILKQADICLLVGSLQYCSTYSDLLKKITDSRIEYIFISKTLIGNIASTSYLQNGISETIIGHHELNRTMYEFGYDICLDLFRSKKGIDLPELNDSVEYRDFLYRLRCQESER